MANKSKIMDLKPPSTEPAKAWKPKALKLTPKAKAAAAVAKKKAEVKRVKDRAKQLAGINFGVGSRHPKAKLTPSNVRAIRAGGVKGVSQSKRAVKYGVTPAVISRIDRGLSYKDVV